MFVVSGNPSVSQGIAVLRTVDWEERSETTLQIARELQPKDGRPAWRDGAFPVTPPSLGQGFRERAGQLRDHDQRQL